MRGRKNGMCIIPQDPVLFAGSLRNCVDPFGTFSDDSVLNALRAVKIASADDRGEEVLLENVEDGGRNFSVGERQLSTSVDIAVCGFNKIIFLRSFFPTLLGFADPSSS